MATPLQRIKIRLSSFLSSSSGQITVVIVVCVLGAYGIIYRDVVSRAKEAYQKGEQYLLWHEHPEKKKDYLERMFNEDKAKLERRLRKNDITEEEFRNKIEALEFDRDFRMKESSLKYAYQWFKDSYELFSPPESTWVKKAREKAPEVLEMWKQELTQKNIPFEDYMFE